MASSAPPWMAPVGRGRRALWIGLGLLAAWIAIRVVWDRRVHTPPEALVEGVYQVSRVVDGDTLLLANGARIRLMGVDCPETVHPERGVEPWGPEAAAFTRSVIAANGDMVSLRFDRERIDRHGRFLAFVFLQDELLNEELVRRGLARAEPGFRYSESMKRRFLAAEKEARRQRAGLWSEGAAPLPTAR